VKKHLPTLSHASGVVAETAVAVARIALAVARIAVARKAAIINLIRLYIVHQTTKIIVLTLPKFHGLT
jgi:hypothetical protein